jgi:hypothetical protein
VRSLFWKLSCRPRGGIIVDVLIKQGKGKSIFKVTLSERQKLKFIED